MPLLTVAMLVPSSPSADQPLFHIFHYIPVFLLIHVHCRQSFLIIFTHRLVCLRQRCSCPSQTPNHIAHFIFFIKVPRYRITNSHLSTPLNRTFHGGHRVKYGWVLIGRRWPTRTFQHASSHATKRCL